MRGSILGMVFAVCAGAQVSARAATITQHIAGTISGPSTVDTMGYFAPAGTDLNGKPFQVYFQYRTNDFIEQSYTVPAGSYPGSTCDIHVSKAPDYRSGSISDVATPGSVLISLEVNGVRRSFAPFTQGKIYLFNSPRSLGELQIDSDFDLAGPTIQVQLFYEYPTSFGGELSPTNNPRNVSYPDAESRDAILLQIPSPGTTSSSGEILNLFVSSYNR